MKKFDGIPALILCAFFWSSGGILVKLVNWNPFAIAGIRSLIAGIIISLSIKHFPIFVIKNEDNSINHSDTFYLWIAGLCYSLTMILYVIANKLTTAANTILLQYTNPLYIILFGPILLSEKNKKSDYLAAIGVMIGMIIFFSDNLEGGNFLGNILAAFSGITFGFTTIFMRKQKSFSSANSFVIAHIITFIISIPFIFLDKRPNLQSVAGLFLLGIFQMGIPSITYSLGIRKVRALTASFITMIEPLLNPIWVIIFAKEFPTIKCIIGGLIILGTISIRSIFQTKQAIQKIRK